MKFDFVAADIDDLEDIASDVKSLIEANDIDILLLYGSMGVGKTTFTKALSQEMGVEDIVTSPTFALVNEYARGDGGLIYHFDFYRINKLEEVFDLGYEEYFYSGNLSIVEWPELIEPIIPYDDSSVKIAKLEISLGEKGDRRHLVLTF